MPPPTRHADSLDLHAGPLAGPLEATESHPSEDAWVRFAARDLDPEARAAMADHIVACPECARTYRAVAEVAHGATQLADAEHRASSSAWRQGLAMAASVALAVAGWSWLIRVPATATVSDVPVVAGPSPAESVVVPAPAAPPTWATLGDPPAVQLPASLTLAMRGPQSDADAFMTAFGPAIAPYRAARFADAAAALAVVAAAHPAVPEAAFYLGIARLHAGYPEDAVEPLRAAAASAVVGADARWWEAVALARAGQLAAAHQALERLCASEGPAARRACDALTASGR